MDAPGGLMPAAEPEDFESEAVPFYPSETYLKRGWKPETSLTVDDIAAIARAAQRAQASGVLPKELAENLLPMAMVEGRSGNFGIRQDGRFYAKPSTLGRFAAMGLDYTGKDSPLVLEHIKGKGLHVGPSGVAAGDPDAYARMMAAILADKYAMLKPGEHDLAIERYNGRGRAIERVDDMEQQADSAFYVEKVRRARQMLQHPVNRKVVDLFNQFYAAAAAPSASQADVRRAEPPAPAGLMPAREQPQPTASPPMLSDEMWQMIMNAREGLGW